MHPALVLCVAALLLLSACGRSAGPEPVVVTPASPTREPTFTPTPTEPPADTATPVAQSELNAENGVVAAALTETETLTTTGEMTGEITGEITEEAAADESPADEGAVETNVENCPNEPDLDLVGYPNVGEVMGCAVAPASYEEVAINEFGEGPEFDRFMLWFSTTGLIYTMLPDGTWQAYPDEWTEDDPEILCNPLGGEATSPPLPRRGFGKLWCSDEMLQQTLGTIPREERLCQHAVTQQFEQGQLLACFEDATIRYFRILEDGSWDMVFVQ